MTVSYTKAQRERAKRDGSCLVTIATPGIEFQGPVSVEEARRLDEYLVAFLKRRREELEKAKEGGAS